MKKTKIMSRLLLLGMCLSLCVGITTINPIKTFADPIEITWNEDESVIVENVIYTKTSDTTVTLSNINDEVSDLVIPSKITVDGQEYDVTAIAERACEYKNNLKSIYIPSTIKNISKWSMGFNENLTKVEFDKDSPITVLPEGIFALDQNLTEITLPSGLKRIKSFAFNACQSLGSLELPDELEVIDSYAFVCMVKGSQLRNDYLDPDVGVDRFDLLIPGSVECVGSNAFAISNNKIYITIKGEGEVTPGGTNLSDLKALICNGGGVTEISQIDDEPASIQEPKVKIVYDENSTLTEDQKVY